MMYALRVQAGREIEAESMIRAIGIETLVPVEMRVVLQRRPRVAATWRRHVLLPGYVFASVENRWRDLAALTFGAIAPARRGRVLRSVRARPDGWTPYPVRIPSRVVLAVLGDPTPLPAHAVDELRAMHERRQELVTPKRIAVGDRVVIPTGDGIVTSINGRRARVLAQFLGSMRETTVDVAKLEVA